MKPQQIQHVQASFAKLVPIADAAAALFYSKLFALDPTLKPLFRGDMQVQGARLMQMIGWAVARLDAPQVLLPALRDLGARHAGYGVRQSHYTTVGAALLQTLEQGLGASFDDEVREAWTVVYGVISETMSAAASAPVAEPMAA